MINLKEYIKQINESKETLFVSSDLIIKGGDHFIDRKFERNVNIKSLEKTFNKCELKILEAIKDGNLSSSSDIVLINKNPKPYLNIVLKYMGKIKNKHYVIVLTIMPNMNFKTSDYTIECYA